MSCKECIHKELCDTYARFGVTDVPLGTDMPCELFMDKSALEKQIPKKPNIHGLREGREINTISYTCLACNKHIGRDAYCKHCGQALDWGNRE
jgi:hypothetical protein